LSNKCLNVSRDTIAMKNFTSEKQKIGKLGEDVACKYLKKKGFVILERNYTRKWGEIDIVSEKNNKLYFGEVKSVSCDFLPNLKDESPFAKRPEENMHPWKLKRLHKIIETYLISHRIGNKSWQLDLLLVYLDLNNRKAKVKVLENIIV
jgi:putative endonuclease